jgi:4-amino-4-deoxy-L-arabinose transferase-like glycosyltransferase
LHIRPGCLTKGEGKIMKKIRLTKETFGISIILILSAILNFANIGIDGYGNEYYAAGVKSMTMSLKNFFFVSFDPAGFVTIDKPPLGFWIQTISAKIFGFSGWSIILPQAIAGVISVWLIYYIVKRSFGGAACLISALCLAVTPVFVAVSRNNTCDNLLVLTLLLACLALSIAAEKGKLKYLLISLVIVGIGFNIKMLQAYMVVPALYITYLLSNAVSIKKRIVHLIAGTAVLLIVSLSWAFVVDLIPAADRPYVGSSGSNSVIQLIVQHNGLERLGIGSTSNSGPGGNQGAIY